jgi:hypothetical protein
MCGDLEEEESEAGSRRDDALYARFLTHTRALLAHAPPPNETPADPTRYMEKLFSDALSRSVKDCEQAGEGKEYDRLIVQPVVFARLAGFLAAHMSLGEDPLRRVMEAMMLGYSEAETMDRERSRHMHGDVPVRA